MDGNPYLTLAAIMEPTPDSFAPKLLTGKVTNISPLKVEAAGLSLAAPQLMVNPELTVARTGTAVGHLTIGLTTYTINSEVTVPPTLAKDDTVLLLSCDYQKFFVICKAVSA